jgi:hypothetical protein
MIEAAGFHDVVAEDRTNQVFISQSSPSPCHALSTIKVLIVYVSICFAVYGSIAEGTGCS